MSIPEARRSGVKILRTIRALDISQAFLQSEDLRHDGRISAFPPPMGLLPRGGKLGNPGDNVQKSGLAKYGFLLLRPLYEGIDAPMRWRLALSEVLRAHGFRQLKCDVCMFAKYDSSAQQIALLVFHVYSILLTGTEHGLQATEEVLRTFSAGGAELLTPKTPIICTGMLLGREETAPRDVRFPKSHYATDPRRIDMAQFANKAKIPGSAKLRTVLRHALGAPIWLHQARPDVGFDIAKIATGAVAATQDCAHAIGAMAMYRKSGSILAELR